MTEIDRLYDVVRKHELRNKGKLSRDGIDPDKGEPIKADKWRNIDFDHNGKSYRCPELFNSKQEAKLYNDEAVLLWQSHAYPNDGWQTLDGILLWRSYSYSIQLPWRE